MAGGFDLNSIMMYQFGHGLATYDDGRPFETPNNFVLTPLDKVVANMLYHATGLSDPDEEALAPGESAQDGSIKTPGQVVRYSFRPASGKVHVIETKGSTPLLVSLLGKRKDPAGRMLATEGANARLMFLPKNPNQDYFIEVRHAKPMKGTGASPSPSANSPEAGSERPFAPDRAGRNRRRAGHFEARPGVGSWDEWHRHQAAVVGHCFAIAVCHRMLDDPSDIEDAF